MEKLIKITLTSLGIFISIYLFSQNASICPNHPDIIGQFSMNQPNYHHYIISEEICNQTVNPCCNKDMVFEVMKSNLTYNAPYAPNVPVQNCQETIIEHFGGIVNKIDHTVYKITNYTKSNHFLHPGKVERYVVEVNKRIFVLTIGTGNNDSQIESWLNEISLSVNIVWGQVNEALKTSIKQRLDTMNCNTEIPHTLFLLDVSGSMNQNNKIDMAKQAAIGALAQIETEGQAHNLSPEVGLMVFSGDCAMTPTRFVQPFTPQLNIVRTTITALPQPTGGTPLPQAVQTACGTLLQRMALVNQSQGAIILLSDGESTCGEIRPPDVYAHGRPGQAQVPPNAKVKIHTIGFDILPGSKAARDLQYLATSTGGRYFHAQDAYQLDRAFQKANRVFSPISFPMLNNAPLALVDSFFVGLAHFQKGAYGQARTALRAYTEQVPADPAGQYNLGQCLEALDLSKAAAAHYAKYLHLHPEAADSTLLIKQIGLLQKDHEVFCKYITEYVASDLQYLQGHYDRIKNGTGETLSQEFLAYLQEKQPFYLELPARLGREGDAGLQAAVENLADRFALAEEEATANGNTWDINGIGKISSVYIGLKQLLVKLKGP